MILGLTAAGLWTDIVGYSVNLLPVDPSTGSSVYNRDAFLVGRLGIGLILLVAAPYIPRIQSVFVGTMALLMSVATGILVISYHQTLIPPDLFAAAGIFIASCGYTVLTWVFYVIFAQRFSTETAVCCIAVSLVLETVLSILLSLYLPAVAQMVVVVLVPLVTATCYFFALRGSTGMQAKTAPKHISHRFDKYAMLVIVAVITAALVFIRILSNVGIWGETRANFTGMTELSISELVIISVVILLLSYLVFILPRHKLSLPLRCIIGLAVQLGGLQILALTNDFQFGYLFDAVTTAIELFAHLVRWMIIIECIRTVSTPYFRVAGVSNTVYSLLTLAWAHIVAGFEFATSTFVMVVVYLLFLIVMGIFMRSHFISGSVFWSQASRENNAALDAFSERWHLSPRESEVFELLMAGKKRSEIEEACALSEGTVKTHISNIYKKLDIHSKREMFQLFEKRLHNEQEGNPTAKNPDS
ncbi:MAG: helix-turn-helix transcriptional regulator [Coriobacteriales bacterium]|jgi:DNA-binding CsgD family transcriptional regulator|nr:helix-turn-helix transcriptional regulator [Coriobacteriales bacterium]